MRPQGPSLRNSGISLGAFFTFPARHVARQAIFGVARHTLATVAVTCASAWGLGADRHHKSLMFNGSAGSRGDAYSHHGLDEPYGIADLNAIE
jgi:hypothetical protein